MKTQLLDRGSTPFNYCNGTKNSTTLSLIKHKSIQSDLNIEAQ